MECNYPTALPDFNLTKVHRKLLKYAKYRIKEGKEDCVCAAIQYGADNQSKSGVDCKYAKAKLAAADLKKFIRRAIDRRVYFETWQHQNGIHRTRWEQRADRVKWIEYILENATWWNE
jgi:hypothetical protein